MNRVAGIVKTHMTDAFSWLMLPWIILGSSFVINVIIGSLSGEEIKTGGLASIFIYMLVIGIISVGQTFPFLISFGARRTDYFLGTTATAALVSVVTAVLLLVIGFIERATGHWGIDLYFFNVPYLTDGPLLTQFWVFFIIMMNLFFFGFVIAAIYRRLGRNGMFGVFLGVGLVFTVAFYLISYYDNWEPIWNWIWGISVLELANRLLVLTLLYAGLSYLLLRRATA
ncbi:hypothetical protein [Cohnella cellulosilytica]|uniref:ABC transporter permease n=1 Tax=Cohnella cellulosilytica TaxID=986710 RepID=A0ABW2F680_9BACL